MSSISLAYVPAPNSRISQGDIFSDVRYSFIDSETDENIEIVEYTFPYAIVVSQSCDVFFMDEFESGQEKPPHKFMPSILMCPIYSMSQIKNANHLSDIYREMGYPFAAPNFFVGDDRKVTQKDMHVRFHQLTINIEEGAGNSTPFMADAVIDFKHIFSLSMKQLQNAREQRVCTLKELYIDQIVNKMCAYIARIGLPV